MRVIYTESNYANFVSLLLATLTASMKLVEKCRISLALQLNPPYPIIGKNGIQRHPENGMTFIVWPT